jgi:2-polyprenyl-3-methyl-5-hydroxy-6-metoxy-1,4-benzoquinol methylase
MWPAEIEWTIEQLDRYLPTDCRTCIDVGSEGEHYRTKRQPWMLNFYGYLARRGIHIYTMDFDIGVNADYIHDITQEPVGIGPFDLVIATHLLEHVVFEKMTDVVRNLEMMVSNGRYLWVSVPNAYPYHERPIDNGWRPTAEELTNLFHGKVIVAATFEVEHTLPQYFDKPKNRMSCAMISY